MWLLPVLYVFWIDDDDDKWGQVMLVTLVLWSGMERLMYFLADCCSFRGTKERKKETEKFIK